MIARWSEWKSFPDAYHGDYIQAPIGPGVYEVCQADTRERVAFGCSHNVAETLTGVLKPASAGKRWFFKRSRARAVAGALEYRTWSLATLTDARVAVEQVVGQRDAIWRRFSPSVRP